MRNKPVKQYKSKLLLLNVKFFLQNDNTERSQDRPDLPGNVFQVVLQPVKYIGGRAWEQAETSLD